MSSGSSQAQLGNPSEAAALFQKGLALQPTALWNAWIPVLVVFSFTGWGFVSKAAGGDPLF